MERFARCTDTIVHVSHVPATLHKIWDEQGGNGNAANHICGHTQSDQTKNCHLDEKSALPTIFPNHFNHLGTSATGMRFKLNMCASSLTCLKLVTRYSARLLTSHGALIWVTFNFQASGILFSILSFVSDTYPPNQEVGSSLRHISRLPKRGPPNAPLH
jgi:hypothetical protein